MGSVCQKIRCERLNLTYTHPFHLHLKFNQSENIEMSTQFRMMKNLRARIILGLSPKVVYYESCLYQSN